MKTNFKYFVIACAFALTTGCATLTNTDIDSLELPITYGTLKVIERDNGVNAGDVVEIVGKVESFVDAEESITGSSIKSHVTSLEAWKELSPADKYLVGTLFTSVEESIEAQVSQGDLLPEDVKVRIEELLDYIRRAALMAN